MSTQTVSPETKDQADFAIAQSKAYVSQRSNPVLRFDPAAHIIEFEFGTRRSTILIILDKMDPFDRIILEDEFVDDNRVEIVLAPPLILAEAPAPEAEADPEA